MPVYSNAAGASPGQHTIPNAILLSPHNIVKHICANFAAASVISLSQSTNAYHLKRCHSEAAGRTPGWLLLPLRGNSPSGNLLVLHSDSHIVPGDCRVGLRPPRNDRRGMPPRSVKFRTKCVKICILFLLNSIPHKKLVFYKMLW